MRPFPRSRLRPGEPAPGVPYRPAGQQEGLSPGPSAPASARERPTDAGAPYWMAKQFADHLVEPTRGSAAIHYLQNHWEKLTLFLRVPGALSNNLCEGAEEGDLHRKNSLFYRSSTAPRSRPLHSLIIPRSSTKWSPSTTWCAAAPRGAVASTPRWMPWNYTAALARRARGADPHRIESDLRAAPRGVAPRPCPTTTTGAVVHQPGLVCRKHRRQTSPGGHRHPAKGQRMLPPRSPSTRRLLPYRPALGIMQPCRKTPLGLHSAKRWRSSSSTRARA